MRSIDLNCAMGESFGRYTLGNDEAVMPLITSANIACGFHAGDPHVMRRTVELAAKHSIGIGAHPGLPDLLGFGRRKMAVTPQDLHDLFLYQIGALSAFARAVGRKLQHVKMHGALFEMSVADESLGRAMCQATKDFDDKLIWLIPAGTNSTAIARGMGLRVVEEFYADRACHPDRCLVSRSKPGAVIHDLACIRDRLVQLFQTGTVATIEGERIGFEFGSICVHGDTPGALDIIRTVREACAACGVEIGPMTKQNQSTN